MGIHITVGIVPVHSEGLSDAVDVQTIPGDGERVCGVNATGDTRSEVESDHDGACNNVGGAPDWMDRDLEDDDCNRVVHGRSERVYGGLEVVTETAIENGTSLSAPV